jgi:hypothetical protein
MHPELKRQIERCIEVSKGITSPFASMLVNKAIAEAVDAAQIDVDVEYHLQLLRGIAPEGLVN